ncbi:MAG TPA: isoprenylcysteine carboxylmethyltransferase family protein [Thermoanaerobaculia bacterium]
MPPETQSKLKTLSVAAVLLIVGAVLGLVAMNSLLARNPAEIAFQVAAVALMACARLTFGRRSFHAAANPTSGGLVTTGPYRLIRHPIYTAACLFIWAGVLSNWSVLAALLGVLVLLGAIVRMLCEERLVVAAYPEYREYARGTKRMVPYVF